MKKQREREESVNRAIPHCFRVSEGRVVCEKCGDEKGVDDPRACPFPSEQKPSWPLHDELMSKLLAASTSSSSSSSSSSSPEQQHSLRVDVVNGLPFISSTTFDLLQQLASNDHSQRTRPPQGQSQPLGQLPGPGSSLSTTGRRKRPSSSSEPLSRAPKQPSTASTAPTAAKKKKKKPPSSSRPKSSNVPTSMKLRDRGSTQNYAVMSGQRSSPTPSESESDQRPLRDKTDRRSAAAKTRDLPAESSATKKRPRHILLEASGDQPDEEPVRSVTPGDAIASRSSGHAKPNKEDKKRKLMPSKDKDGPVPYVTPHAAKRKASIRARDRWKGWKALTSEESDDFERRSGLLDGEAEVLGSLDTISLRSNAHYNRDKNNNNNNSNARSGESYSSNDNDSDRQVCAYSETVSL